MGWKLCEKSCAGVYRFGFQGQEQDDEVKGVGNHIHFTFRGYDTRSGRMWSVDPLAPKYPFYSPYAFSGNRVIDVVELEGLEPTGDPASWDVIGDVTRTPGEHGETLMYPIAAYGQNGTSKEGTTQQGFWVKEEINGPGKAGKSYSYANPNGEWEVFRDDEATRQHRMQSAEQFGNVTVGALYLPVLLIAPELSAAFYYGAGINFGVQVGVHSGIEYVQTGSLSISNVLLNKVDYADVALGGVSGGISSLYLQGLTQVLLPSLVDFTGGNFAVVGAGKSVNHTLIDAAFNVGGFGLARGFRHLAGSYTPEAAKMARIDALLNWTNGAYGRGSFAGSLYRAKIQLTVGGTAMWRNLSILSQSTNFNTGFDVSNETTVQTGSNLLKEK